MSVFKGVHCANKPGMGGKGPLSMEAAAGKAAPGRGWGRNGNPSGAQQGSSVSPPPRQTVTSEPLYSQPCSVTLPDSSEQMTGLAVKQGEWLPCSAQESIS